MAINIDNISTALDPSNIQKQINDGVNSIVQDKLKSISPMFEKVGEIKNGFESLTSIISDFDVPIATNNNAEIEGTSNMTKQVGGDKSDLDAITEGSIEDFVPDVIITAGTPDSISKATSAITGDAVEQIAGSLGLDFDVSSLLKDPKSMIGDLVSQTGILEKIKPITDNTLIDIMLNNDKSPINDVINTIGVDEATAEAFIKRKYDGDDEGAKVIINTNNINGLTDEEIEEYADHYDMSLYALTEERTYNQTPQSYNRVGYSGQNASSGSYGTGNFTIVSSAEELEADFRTATRDITEVVVHWTAHFTDQNIGSEEVHQIHLNRGFSGIGYHYIIRRDGTIQRGRPINNIGAHALDNGHNNYSIGVSMVGGYNCPSSTQNPERYVSCDSLTRAQYNSLDTFLEKFYMVWPGGQAWGHVDTDNKGKVDPGFDIPDYVRRKWGKVNVSPSGKNPPLTPAQLSQRSIS